MVKNGKLSHQTKKNLNNLLGNPRDKIKIFEKSGIYDKKFNDYNEKYRY